jgi:type I restriction enzyme, S subunit
MSKTTEYKLADIFPVSMSGEWGSDPFDEGNALVLRAADFTKDCKLRATIGAPRNIPQLKLGNRVLKDGDILIEKSGGSPDQPVGRVAFFDRGEDKEVYVHSNFLQLLRVAEGFDKKFCYYLMAFLYSKGLVFRYQQQTTGIINLKLENYLKEKVSVPSVSVQRQIQEILSTIDRTITHTEALIEKYQQIKAGLMHDLFTRGIGADGKLRPPRHKAPELYRESSIGWIPKEWSFKSVESLGGLVTSGSRDWAQYYSNEGDLFIRIGNLTREHINFRLEKVQYVLPPKNSDGQRTKLMGDDILVSITADLGIIGVIPKNLGDAYINQHIALIRFSDRAINSRFFGHFFASQAFQKYVDRMNDGGAKAGLNLPAVRAFPVVMTSRNEQDTIVQKLDAIDIQVDIEKKVLLKLCQQKSGLMHDLLTGTVRVNIDPV